MPGGEKAQLTPALPSAWGPGPQSSPQPQPSWPSWPLKPEGGRASREAGDSPGHSPSVTGASASRLVQTPQGEGFPGIRRWKTRARPSAIGHSRTPQTGAQTIDARCSRFWEPCGLWRLRIRGEGAGRAGFVPRPLPLACRRPAPHCVLVAFPSCVGAEREGGERSRETETETETGEGEERGGEFRCLLSRGPQSQGFNHRHLLRGPISKYSHAGG